MYLAGVLKKPGLNTVETTHKRARLWDHYAKIVIQGLSQWIITRKAKFIIEKSVITVEEVVEMDSLYGSNLDIGWNV